jgi:hypothetical protein
MNVGDLARRGRQPDSSSITELLAAKVQRYIAVSGGQRQPFGIRLYDPPNCSATGFAECRCPVEREYSPFVHFSLGRISPQD